MFKNFLMSLTRYNNRTGADYANKFLDLKVKNPFNRDETIILSDLLIMGIIDEKHILETCEMYGIKFPEEAVDASQNNVLDYMLYHGKQYQFEYVNANGEKIIAGVEKINEIPMATEGFPLLPADHVEKMINLFQGNSETWNSVFGQAAEFGVKDSLIKNGYEVLMPAARNYEATDLIVEKKFFDDKGLNYSEVEGMPGFGKLQVKTTSGINPTNDCTANTIHHLTTNEDIPVVCSTKIYDQIPDEYKGKLIPFSDLGINDKILESNAYFQYLQIRNFDVDVDSISSMNGVLSGLDASQFSDIVDNARTSVISTTLNDSGVIEHSLNIGLHNIPMIGICIRGTISTMQNYRKYKNGEIKDLSILFKNVGYDVTKTGVIGTATAIGSGLVLGALGTSSTEIFSGVCNWLSGDDSSDAAEALGEAALGLAVIAGVGYLAKAAWNALFDPKKELMARVKKYNEQAMTVCSEVILSLTEENFIQLFCPPVLPNMEQELSKISEEMTTIKKNNKILPLPYYVYLRKKELFEVLQKELLKRIQQAKSLYYRMKYTSLYSGQIVIEGFGTTSKETLEALYINQNNKLSDVFKKVHNNDEKFLEVVYSLVARDVESILGRIRGLKMDNLQEKIDSLDKLAYSVNEEHKRLVDSGRM